MIGLLSSRRGGREFAALDGVNIDIARGEKVAVIGRNGAGKSTFLKIVSQVIRPTSGTMEVAGKVHALLQIGTGFHPDFTGRQNVLAYFAQLGVTSTDATRHLEEVIDFAELREYIDQPLATYSTGMAVRLMFAASTALVPDLLLLDEVLGVGDAYFAQKSFDRISTLCAHERTTLLLVTHDLYSAARVCKRIVWLDRGRVVLDGDAASVVTAYEESIRHQEEARLRTEKQRRLAAHRQSTIQRETQLLVEIKNAEPGFLPCPVYFGRIALQIPGHPASDVSIGAEAFDASRLSHLESSASAWGDAAMWHGRLARAFLNFGSPFQKVVAALAAPDQPLDRAVVTVDYWSAEPCRLSVRGFVDGIEYDGGLLPPSSGAWVRHEAALARRDTPSSPVAAVTGVHGSGAVAITDVRAVDARGTEVFSVRHGDPFELQIAFRIQKPGFSEPVQTLVAFLKDGIQDVCRLMTRDLVLDAASAPTGIISVRMPRLTLAPGTYAISVLIANAGYYDERQSIYFSVNPNVHACLSRVFEVEIHGGGPVATGTVVVADGEWSVTPSVSTTPAL